MVEAFTFSQYPFYDTRIIMNGVCAFIRWTDDTRDTLALN
jgi:hypothetical protein